MALPKFLEDMDPNIYLSENYVVLDFEIDTSHGDYGHPVHPDNQMLLAVWKYGKAHPKYPAYGSEKRAVWGSEFELEELLNDIRDADFLVAHSSKYELGWLRRSGLDLRTVLPFDTMLAEKVLLGNLGSGDDFMAMRDIDLDTACRRRGLPIKDPIVDLLIHEGINPVEIPRQWLEQRCRQDVDSAEVVFKDQLKYLQDTNRLAVVYTRCLFTPVLAEMEFEGMALDPERVEETHADYSKQMVQLSSEMDAFTGGINWRSPDQSAAFIYDVLQFDELRDWRGNPKRTPGGDRKTDKKTLEALLPSATTDRQKDFVALRNKLGKVNAALSKNLDFFLGVVREYGGKFVGQFNQHKTATDRTSSNGVPLVFDMFRDEKGIPQTKSVQFQNMPRAFKRLLKAKRPGWLIFDPDGSMLEFRVAAFLGQDSQAIADVEDVSWDAHVTSGSEMESMAYEKLYKLYKAGDKKAELIRQDAKPETFKPLYGGEMGTPKQMLWYAAFKRRYHELVTVQEGWANDVVKNKLLVTPWGLRFYWPYARKSSTGRINVKSAVYNYPVQSLATAEIIPIAVVYFWHRLREREIEDYVVIVNTVHDDVPCEVHPDYVDAAKATAKQAFTKDVYDYLKKVYKIDFNVPLGVGIKVGEHWGEGKEESYDIYPDGREVRRK